MCIYVVRLNHSTLEYFFLSVGHISRGQYFCVLFQMIIVPFDYNRILSHVTVQMLINLVFWREVCQGGWELYCQNERVGESLKMIDLILLSKDDQHVNENFSLLSLKSFCLPEAKPLCRDDSGREHFPPLPFTSIGVTCFRERHWAIKLTSYEDDSDCTGRHCSFELCTDTP